VLGHRLAVETPIMPGSIRNRFSAGFRRLFRSRPLRRFVRHENGAAAIEFGMVAAPFLGLVCAIMETALVFFAGQTLETAVTDSARLIMVGTAQTSGWSKDDFKTAVCTKVYSLFDCANGIYVDVKTYDSFSAITNDPPLTNGDVDPAKLSYSPGGVGAIEVVTLYYQWKIYLSLFSANLSNMNGNNRLLVATAVFRNEPYQ